MQNDVNEDLSTDEVKTTSADKSFLLNKYIEILVNLFYNLRNKCMLLYIGFIDVVDE